MGLGGCLVQRYDLARDLIDMASSHLGKGRVPICKSCCEDFEASKPTVGTFLDP